MNGFANLWGAIGAPIMNASGQISTALMADVRVPFQACVLAWLIISLMIQFYEPNEQTVLEFLKQVGIAAIILAVATNTANFQYYVTGVATWLVNTITTAIAGAVGQGGAPVTAGSFDTIAVKTFAVGAKVLKLVPWYSFKSIPLGVMVVVYWFLTSAAILAMFIFFLIASISMAFIISFGPVFICLAFFPYTRRFFDGWVSAVAGAILTQIFVLALLALFALALDNLLQPITAAVTGDDDAGLIITALLELCTTACIALAFCFLVYFSVRLAVTIASTVGVAMPRVPVASFGRPLVGGGGGGPPGGGGGFRGPPGPPGGFGSGSGGGAVAGLPPRQYAFTRSVGGAP
jgi:type IV secretion system protein VirB6